MRHAKKRHRLGRTASHRKATLQALSSALLRHKRITTTEPKAKALRVFVEPIITRAKEDSAHNRRQAFRRLQNKEAVKYLFDEVAEAVGNRPGGYTRVIKLGKRSGDAAEMALIELVDFNDVKPEGGSSSRKRTRRGGGRGRRRRKTTEESNAKSEDTTQVEVGEQEEDLDSEETISPESDEENVSADDVEPLESDEMEEEAEPEEPVAESGEEPIEEEEPGEEESEEDEKEK